MMAFSVCIALSSCDDTTEAIGSSLTNYMDRIQIATDTFEVSSRSVRADSVLARSNMGYVGKVRDPETGGYVTGDFMMQFNTLEGMTDYLFPRKDSVVSVVDGEVVADSCEIRLFYDSFYGDSLAPMTIRTYEMDKPMEENVNYYSNFDPTEEGLIREGGLCQRKTYTLTDLSVSDSTRKTSAYVPSIRILLNDPYTDKDGVTYSNYGTYIMRKYYENSADFENAYSFIHNICPGFYIKNEGGLGNMANVYISQLRVHFRYMPNDSTVNNGVVNFPGTEEVLQATRISNDDATIGRLLEDKTCTYVKSPAGIFTELVLPVDEIMSSHPNDTLSSAKIVLTRVNNTQDNIYSFDLPQNLLMLPKDSLYSFFENRKLHNNTTSFLAPRDYSSYNSTTGVYTYKNTYTFNNISNLVRLMAEQKKQGGSNYTTEHPDWNKVVIVPVAVSTTTVNNSTVYNSITNDMSLRSTRLVGGDANPHDKLQISVVYSKFNND